jgi:hypothetical protein
MILILFFDPRVPTIFRPIKKELVYKKKRVTGARKIIQSRLTKSRCKSHEPLNCYNTSVLRWEGVYANY